MQIGALMSGPRDAGAGQKTKNPPKRVRSWALLALFFRALAASDGSHSDTNAEHQVGLWFGDWRH